MKNSELGSNTYSFHHGVVTLMMAEIHKLSTEILQLRKRVSYLEEVHAEEENQKDRMRGWEYEPDTFDEDCCSKADFFEKQYAEERRKGR